MRVQGVCARSYVTLDAACAGIAVAFAVELWGNMFGWLVKVAALAHAMVR